MRAVSWISLQEDGEPCKKVKNLAQLFQLKDNDRGEIATNFERIFKRSYFLGHFYADEQKR